MAVAVAAAAAKPDTPELKPQRDIRAKAPRLKPPERQPKTPELKPETPELKPETPEIKLQSPRPQNDSPRPQS